MPDLGEAGSTVGGVAAVIAASAWIVQLYRNHRRANRLDVERVDRDETALRAELRTMLKEARDELVATEKKLRETLDELHAVTRDREELRAQTAGLERLLSDATDRIHTLEVALGEMRRLGSAEILTAIESFLANKDRK